MNPIIDKARNFAIDAHGNQKYGKHDYQYHLCMVHSILTEANLDDDYIIAAGWLHDVVEDTHITFRQMYEEFGKNIARLVYAVTDEPGNNRKERKMRTYPKLIAAGRSAIAIKLADRIANVEHSLTHSHKMFQMYQTEYSDFRAKLKMPGELKCLWARLDNLMNTEIENEKN